MLTDLVQIRRLGENNRGENERFRRHLKTHSYHEKKFRAMAQEIQDQIDCRQCANCCRVGTTKIADRDVEKLAKFLRITPAAFIRDYTAEHPEEGRILKRIPGSGCVFLSGNDCTVYEARPHVCEYFPHLVRGEGSVVSRMWAFIDRATYCPITFNVLEAFKEQTRFRR
jgi:Fe-S-cluster containining protein